MIIERRDNVEGCQVKTSSKEVGNAAVYTKIELTKEPCHKFAEINCLHVSSCKDGDKDKFKIWMEMADDSSENYENINLMALEFFPENENERKALEGKVFR